MWATFAFLLSFTLVSSSFIKIPSNVVYKHGEQTVGHITCEISPDDASGLLWQFLPYNSEAVIIIYFNLNFVRESGKYSISDDAARTGNFTLTIYNLTRNDSGQYTCQLDAMAKVAELTVADPPGIPIVGIDGLLVENTTAEFTCEHVGGFPIPTYSWILNGSSISSERFTDVEEDGVTKSRLSLMMRYSYDKLKLECQTSNVLNSTRAGSILDVEYSPRVGIAEQQLIVLRNQPFTLTCQVSHNPAYTELQWFRGADVINGANSPIYTAPGLDTDKQFSCQVTNRHGTGRGSTLVTVHYGPEVQISEGGSVTINEWDTLSASCVAGGKPAASVRWKKGEQILSTSGQLEIKLMPRQDRGEYTCVATNMVTPTGGDSKEMSAAATLSVTVNYAADTPTLRIEPVSFSGYHPAGKRITLYCTMEDPGNPEAQIKWYQSRNPGNPLSTTDSSLTIELPQVNNTDEYFCEAVNSVGSIKSNYRLLQFMDVPTLLMGGGAAEDNVSRSMLDYTIGCTYRAFPSARITWHKDGELLSSGGSYRIEEQEDTEGDNYPYVRTSSTLTIHNGGDGVQIRDSGRYSCSAENRAGRSRGTYTKQVNVIYSPYYNGYGKVAANLSSSASIRCEVSSYPPVTSISFTRDDAELADTLKYTLKPIEYEIGGLVNQQQREMIIQDVTNADYGVYTCLAVNGKGRMQQEIKLLKTSRPDPPTSLVHSELSWHSVSLTWQPGFDGGLRQMFTVYKRWGSEELVYGGIMDTGYRLDGLLPAMQYTLRVLASNSKGSSESYIEQVVTTPELHIPAATLVYNADDKSISISINSTEYCTILQGSTDGITFTSVTSCEASIESVSIADFSYTSYQALTCVPLREDVCNQSKSITMDLGSRDNKGTVIGVSVAVAIFLVIIVIIIVIVIVKMRRKGRIQKSVRNAAKAGHVNPVMTPNGVPGEVHYSNPGGYNINSDLEMDDSIEELPYGEIKHRESPVQSKQPYENLDYTYASLQKKPSEQNKLNEAAAYDTHIQPSSLNIHDPSSVSDNSEVDGYELPGMYPTDRLAEFLGPDVMALRRLPSNSESGYSTPDSRQLKKVVYEVIV